MERQKRCRPVVFALFWMSQCTLKLNSASSNRRPESRDVWAYLISKSGSPEGLFAKSVPDDKHLLLRFLASARSDSSYKQLVTPEIFTNLVTRKASRALCTMSDDTGDSMTMMLTGRIDTGFQRFAGSRRIARNRSQYTSITADLLQSTDRSIKMKGRSLICFIHTNVLCRAGRTVVLSVKPHATHSYSGQIMNSDLMSMGRKRASANCSMTISTLASVFVGRDFRVSEACRSSISFPMCACVPPQFTLSNILPRRASEQRRD